MSLPLDTQLVARIDERLKAKGIEASMLRGKLLVALIAAAELAGDKDEARALVAQHTEFCRARAGETSRG